MYKIVRKQELNASVTLMEIEAPFVARKAKAGQFIIFRIDEMGERVPLTIAGYDREKGTVPAHEAANPVFHRGGDGDRHVAQPGKPALKQGDSVDGGKRGLFPEAAKHLPRIAGHCAV